MDKIMIVDDEKNIVFMLQEFMKVNSIDVVGAYSGEEALSKLDENIKLILLDINMDGINGMETCKLIRKKSNIPIIFLSSKSSQYDKVVGLGIGADDYITKPFDPVELVARVKAHLRRSRDYNKSNETVSIINFGDITIIRNSKKILKKNKEIQLSPTEFNLLLYLVDNAQTVLSRKQILINVWESSIYDENTVNTYIKRLRHKIEDSKENPLYIKSVRGFGYIFDMEILKGEN